MATKSVIITNSVPDNGRLAWSPHMKKVRVDAPTQVFSISNGMASLMNHDEDEGLTEKTARFFESFQTGRISDIEVISNYAETCREYADHGSVSLLHLEGKTWSLIWFLLKKDHSQDDLEQFRNILPESEKIAHSFLEANSEAAVCQKVLAWLESCAAKDLKDIEGYDFRHGLRLATMRLNKRERSGAPKHVDPDSSSRENFDLHKEDEKFELSLLKDVWKLIRAGKWEEAIDLCRLSGQAWRAATLAAYQNQTTVTRFVDCSPARQVAWLNLQALEMEQGHWQQRRLWKWTNYIASEKLAKEVRPSSEYESAIFGSMCSNVERVLPVCTHWEDVCWALMRSFLDYEFDKQLSGSSDTSSAPPAIRWSMERPADVWPDPVAPQQPLNLSDILSSLQVETEEQLTVSDAKDCVQEHRIIQLKLIQAGVLDAASQILDFVLSHSYTPGSKAELHMVRFAVHLVLFWKLSLNGFDDQGPSRFTADTLIERYTTVLQLNGLSHLAPLYAAHATPCHRETLMVAWLKNERPSSMQDRERLVASMVKHLPWDGLGSVSSILGRVFADSRLQWIKKGGIAWQSLLVLRLRDEIGALQWYRPPRDPGAERDSLYSLSCVALRELALAAANGHIHVCVDSGALFSLLRSQFAQQSPGQASRREIEFWDLFFDFHAAHDKWTHSPGSSHGDASAVDLAKRALRKAEECLDSMAAVSTLPEKPRLEKTVQLQFIGVLCDGNGNPLSPENGTVELLRSSLQQKIDSVVADAGQPPLLIIVSMAESEGQYVRFSITATGQSHEAASDALISVSATLIRGELPNLTGAVFVPLQVDSSVVHLGDCREPYPTLTLLLCLQCCAQSLVLRYMDLRVFVSASVGLPADDRGILIQKLVDPDIGICRFFTPQHFKTVIDMERKALLSCL